MAHGISAVSEFSEIRLGDRRLNQRWLQVMGKVFSSPETSLNEAMGTWCEAKAAYRIFSHEKLTSGKILAAHREQIQKRAEDHDELLVLHDTTSLVFTSHIRAQGLGSIAQGFKGKFSQGLFVHTSYVTSPTGMPIGVLDQTLWSRAESKKKKHPLHATEKVRWITGVRYSPLLTKGRSKKIIHVCDREADYWDLMSKIHTQNESFVIRMIHRKELKPALQKMFTKPSKLGEVHVFIETRKNNEDPTKTKFHKKRTKATICFEIAVAELDFENTSFGSREGRETLKITVVRALEKNPPKDRKPLEWLLKTDLKVETLGDAKRIIEIYGNRWKIESFHKALKSGCLVEKSRLGSADKLKKYVTAMSVAAWRLSVLSLISRENPNLSCSLFFSSAQWKSLYCKTHRTEKLPKKPPTLDQAIRWIAQLGGFMNRKGDGPPGMQTLWRGWNKLSEMADLYELLKGK